MFIPVLLVSGLLITIFSYFGTKLSIKLSGKFDIFDNPKSNPDRKFQSLPIPLNGFFFSFIIGMFLTGLIWFLFKIDWNNLGRFLGSGLFFPFKLYWILFGAAIIYLAGILDDKFSLKPIYYFSFIFTGLFVTVFLGELKIESLSYPLSQLNLKIGILPEILAFVWIGAALVCTKFLDGMDGLVASIGTIGFFTIAITAGFSQSVFQPLILIFGLIWGFCCLGFLPNNLPNAKTYLGDGGSTIIGYFLGVFSILSGAKVATTITVLGWFIIDIIFVMIYRIYKYRSIKGLLKGDSSMHWHHRLLNLGLGKRQVLLITVILTIFSGAIGIFTPTRIKILLIPIQILVILSGFIYLEYKGKVKKN